MKIDELKPHLEDLRMDAFVDKSTFGSVPCIETSDAKHLCAAPVVSVIMRTYNHADNIRDAIEGVMMQKTDFPYELIIAEDASSDCTREICFELQRKYPERIRVLWSEKNVFHMGQGNARRADKAVRGEFIAYCDGDDRWIDPDKLQRQVNLMRNNMNVGICLGGTEVEYIANGSVEAFPYAGRGICVMNGKVFVEKYLKIDGGGDFLYKFRYFQTSGYLFRSSLREEATRRFPEAYRWNWKFGDIILLTSIAMISDVAFIYDSVSRYRLAGTGLTMTLGDVLYLDVRIYAIYLRVIGLGQTLEVAIDGEMRHLRRYMVRILEQKGKEFQIKFAEKISDSFALRRLFMVPGYRLSSFLLRKGALTYRRWKHLYRIGRICDRILCKK